MGVDRVLSGLFYNKITTTIFGWLAQDVPTQEIGIEVTFADTDAYIPVKYGRGYGGGLLVFQASNDADNDDIKNDLLHQIIIWSEGNCGGIVGNYIDDEISTSTRFNAENGGKWYFAQNFRNGMGAYSDINLTLSGKRSTDTFDGKLVSYVRSEMTQDVWNGQPQHKAEWTGRLIPSPSSTSLTASQNPISQLYDLLQSPIYGKDLSASKIDLPSFQAAATYCDSQVETFTNSGVYRSLFTSNVSIDTGKPVIDNVNTLLRACRAWLFHSDGKLKGLIEKDDAAVDFTIDENAQGFVGWGDVGNSSKTNRYNRVICRWIDPDSGWTKQEAIYPPIGSQKETDLLAEDNGILLEKSIALDTCIYYHEALHHASTMLEVSREQLRTQVTWGPEASILEVGDILPAVRLAMGWAGKLFRIETVEKSLTTGQVTLQLREHQPYIYDDHNTGNKPNLPDTNLTYDKPATPTNLAASDIYDDFAQVNISWDSTTNDHQIVIIDSSDNQLVNANISGKNYRINQFGIGTYSIRVYAIGGLGRKSVGAALSFNIAQTPTPTIAPTVTSTPGKIIVTPNQPGTISGTYEGLYTTSSTLDPNTDAVSGFTFIPSGTSLQILNPVHDQVYYVWYRIKTIEGAGLWRVVSVTGVGLNAQQVSGLFDVSDDNLAALIASSDREFVKLSDRVTEEEIRTLQQLDNDIEAVIDLQTNTVKIGTAESNISTLNIQSDSYASQLNQITHSTKGILAEANNYTFTGVGYYNDAGAWEEGALSERIRNVQVTLADGTYAKVTDIAQAFQGDNGDLFARGGMITDVNDRVGGFMTNNNGATTQFDIISSAFRVGDYVGGNPANSFVPYMYAVSGQLIVDNSWVRAEAMVIGAGTTSFLAGKPVLVNAARVNIGNVSSSIVIVEAADSLNINRARMDSTGRVSITRGLNGQASLVFNDTYQVGTGLSVWAKTGTGAGLFKDGVGDFTAKHPFLRVKKGGVNPHGMLISEGAIEQHININGALSYAALSITARDRKAVGVVDQSVKLTSETGEGFSSLAAARRVELKDTHNLSLVNSLGEGLMWVCSEAGDIQSHQWLCSSSTLGHAMLQTDETTGYYEKYCTDYTVAKSRENVIWANEPSNKKLIAVYYKGG